MNTIYDGTFVLGQTSALNFEAGPGITVSQPSAGIVRIGNDETVLWSGTSFTPNGSNTPVRASASLSEPVTNFEKVRLDFSGGTYFNESVTISDYRLTRSCFLNVKKEQNNNGVYIGCMYLFPNATTISGYVSYGDTQNVTANTGGYWGYGGVCKVIGCNRISGGNT